MSAASTTPVGPLAGWRYPRTRPTFRSLQLSYAVVPLVYFTSQRRKMGSFVNSPLLAGTAWAVALVIGGLNAWLLICTLRAWLA